MSTPNNDNPDPLSNTFAEIERELITRGKAATYFAATLASLPDIPQQIRQEAQYFLWFGRCPTNVDIEGRVS